MKKVGYRNINNNRNATFSDDEIKEIWKRGWSERKIARYFRVSRGAIIVRKRKLHGKNS